MSFDNTVLAIDIGNTRAKFGHFRKLPNGCVQAIEIVARRLSDETCLATSLSEWWRRQAVAAPSTAMIAASDPETRDLLLQRWPFENCRPQTIAGFRQIPIAVDIDMPERVGVDRLLNGFAASRLRTTRRAVIVVDSGTATTVDLITSDNTFRGGSILPGLRLSAHAMHDYTARLPLLNVDEELCAMPAVPGRNTEAAMRAGLFIGQLGAVKELIARLAESAQSQFGETELPQVFLTGGGGRQLFGQISGATYIDSLPLHALAMLSDSSSREK